MIYQNMPKNKFKFGEYVFVKTEIAKYNNFTPICIEAIEVRADKYVYNHLWHEEELIKFAQGKKLILQQFKDIKEYLNNFCSKRMEVNYQPLKELN